MVGWKNSIFFSGWHSRNYILLKSQVEVKIRLQFNIWRQSQYMFCSVTDTLAWNAFYFLLALIQSNSQNHLQIPNWCLPFHTINVVISSFKSSLLDFCCYFSLECQQSLLAYIQVQTWPFNVIVHSLHVLSCFGNHNNNTNNNNNNKYSV